jgi:ppGpp synthetase/RelA/SpoT-type nucleotidyltranferase
MSLNIAQISNQWNIDKPKLNILGQQVVSFLKKGLFSLELHPEISYRTKEIQSIIKKIQKKQKEQKEQKEKPYEYNDLRDKLGVRIICPFLFDLDIVDTFLKEHFVIKKEEKKKDKIDFNKLDYQSNHYDVSVKNELIDFDSEFIFEIQVRTMNQHAWANSAHILYYKQDIELPDEMKHKIYRLLSLYELADEEFQKVNEYLKTRKDDLVYTLLRRLEGKLYKYAETDFDRELSVENLTTLLTFFTQEEQNKIDSEIELFIRNSDSKIQHIFNDNRNRYADIPLLTQPEIFIIWYGLEKYLFSITDNWNNYFDESELEIIQTLWC